MSQVCEFRLIRSRAKARLATADEVAEGTATFTRRDGENGSPVFDATFVLKCPKPFATTPLTSGEATLTVRAGKLPEGKGWDRSKRNKEKTGVSAYRMLNPPLISGLQQVAVDAEQVDLYFFHSNPREAWLCVTGYRSSFVSDDDLSDEEAVLQGLARTLDMPC